MSIDTLQAVNLDARIIVFCKRTVVWMEFETHRGFLGFVEFLTPNEK